jgi:hypothetical protein
MIGIAVQMLYDRSKEAEARYNRAAKAGVTASAQTLLNALKRAYNKYYTSENFRSTLQIRQSLRRSDTEKGPEGYFAIVGVPTAMVTPGKKKGDPKSLFDKPVDRGKVALYWELGHYNVFTRKFERVEIAVPAANEAAQAMSDAWARTVKRYMEAP